MVYILSSFLVLQYRSKHLEHLQGYVALQATPKSTFDSYTWTPLSTSLYGSFPLFLKFTPLKTPSCTLFTLFCTGFPLFGRLLGVYRGKSLPLSLTELVTREYRAPVHPVNSKQSTFDMTLGLLEYFLAGDVGWDKVWMDDKCFGYEWITILVNSLDELESDFKRRWL